MMRISSFHHDGERRTFPVTLAVNARCFHSQVAKPCKLWLIGFSVTTAGKAGRVFEDFQRCDLIELDAAEVAVHGFRNHSVLSAACPVESSDKRKGRSFV
jgi:hypothetical protein